MVGESNYTECMVKRKGSTADSVKKGLMLFFIAAVAIFALITTGLVQILGFVLLVVTFVLVANQWPKFKAEYEYIFVDGQIDFDVVYSGSTRKHLKRIDLEKTDVVAPVGDAALDGYKHLELKAADYTSREEGKKVYAIFTKGEKGPEKILFEPDENFLQFMKKKSPRKVII